MAEPAGDLRPHRPPGAVLLADNTGGPLYRVPTG